SGPFYGLRPRVNSLNIFYLLGLLNSDLFGFVIASQSTQMRGGYIKFSKQYIEKAPIRTINFDDSADVARHDQMVALVERMLALHEQVAAAGSPTARRMLERQIEAIDRQIDALVYELYGLTDEEVRIVEGEGRA
ncbi:MAG: restriction endonuclease subunit M, partial [Chloroflexi bacterium]|nr:restriction endonuclease subunit M [Chloroflexota bacterium]